MAKIMNNTRKRIELAKKLYAEKDRRQKIEDEAFELMSKGKYLEGNELLDTLDDGILLGILDELDELQNKNGAEKGHKELIEKISNPKESIFPLSKKKENEYVLFKVNNGTDTFVGRFESDIKPSKLLKEFRLFIKWKQKEEIEKLFDKIGFGL